MHKIAVIPGDGTGPEVAAKASRSSRRPSQVRTSGTRLHALRLRRRPLPAHRRDAARHAPSTSCREFDAILLGAVGHPDVKPGILEKGILLRAALRARPVHQPAAREALPRRRDAAARTRAPSDIDFVVVRENTEGLYAGAGGFLHKGTPHEVATQEAINTRKGVRALRPLRLRVHPQAQQAARRSSRSCAKTNVLTYAPRPLVARVPRGGRAEYPDIKPDYNHVDASCMWMVKNPECYDVIVTDNMFGDIITDLGAMIQGGMGVAAGGNINPEGGSACSSRSAAARRSTPART